MKHRIFALLLCALCLLTGCRGAPDDGPQKQVDTVNVSNAYFGLAYYNQGTLNPVLNDVSVNRLVCEALYEGLFTLSNNFTAQNMLCADYTGDGTTFTFTLRDDVQFWSGAPLTADDVVASLQTAWYNEQSPYYNRMAEVGSIEAVSNNEVRITLTSPNINFPCLLDIPIFRSGTQEQDFAEGTGPFRPEKEGSQYILLPNENWHNGFLGSIRRITLVSMTSAEAAASSFQTGNVSLLRQPRIAPEGTGARFDGSVEAVRVVSADLHYLGLNYENSGLANAKVRQALSAALGRQSLCDTQLQTFADPAVLPVNPQPQSTGLTLNMDADTGTAAALLEEAALEEPLSIRLLVNEDNTFKVAAAEQIAASWGALGIQVTVDKQPYSAYLEALANRSFDVYYGETLLTPDFDLRPLIAAGGSLNYGGYADAHTAGAISAARRGEDVTALYRCLLSEMPIIPIAFEHNQLIIRKGLVDNLTPTPYNAFAALENWTTSG